MHDAISKSDSKCHLIAFLHFSQMHKYDAANDDRPSVNGQLGQPSGQTNRCEMLLLLRERRLSIALKLEYGELFLFFNVLSNLGKKFFFFCIFFDFRFSFIFGFTVNLILGMTR